MPDINDIRPSLKDDGTRNADKIRQDIAQAEQEMSQTVEQIGDRIKEKLDWQEYVKETPYLALGIAAGVGYLASALLVKKRSSMDRLLDLVGDEVRGAAGGMVARTAGPGIVKVTLLGIASKAAVNWLQNAARQERPRRAGSGRECCQPTTQETPTDSKIII